MMQHSLFEQEINLRQGDLRYHPQWLERQEAAQLLDRLIAEVSWDQPTLNLFNRSVKTPRLTAWYGDKGCYYTYSNTRFPPLPWLPILQQIRERLLATIGESFNSVLLNYYRNGTDSMSWHSDDEPELGDQPIIASLSLGESRRMLFRRKDNHKDKHEIHLEHGSLLLMKGDTQQYWQHQIPKSQKNMGPRINLTFRTINHESE